MPRHISDHPTTFRLLHATGESFIADRGEALHRMAHLPGARLFIVRAERPIMNAYDKS